MVERAELAEQTAELAQLTSEHWREILARSPSNQVRAVARCMLDGNIFDPVPYLGKRHWAELGFIRTWDEVRTPRWGFLPDKISKVENPIALKIRDIALKQMKATDETLQDRFSLARAYLSNNPTNHHRYSYENGRWVGRMNEVVDHEPGIGYVYGSKIITLDEQSVVAHLRFAYKVSEKEVQNILSIPSDQIEGILLQLARTNPDNYPRVEQDLPHSSQLVI